MAKCAVCKKPLPFFRIPENKRELLWGGWTCENCGSELDRKGNLIKTGKDKKKEQEDRLYREEYIKEKARLKAQKEHKKK